MAIKSKWFEHAGRTYEARADDNELPECLEVCIYDADGQPRDLVFPGGLAGRVHYMVYFGRPLTASDDAIVDSVIAQAQAAFQAASQ